MYMRSKVLGLFTVALMGTTAMAAQPVKLDLTIKPIVKDGLVTALDVTSRIDPAKGSLDPLILPDHLAQLFHIADRITEIDGHDAKGAFKFNVSSGKFNPNTPTPLGDTIRIWTPARKSTGTVTVHYVAQVSKEMLAGPSWEIRSEKRGVSASALTFLLLPEAQAKYKLSFHWDLSQMPKGATTITTLPADYKTKPVDTERLKEALFMAGDLYRVDAGNFHAASTAETPYSQMELLNWTAKAYHNYMGYFGPPPKPTFTVMFRGSLMSRISGTEAPDGLLATMMPDTPLPEVENLAAHEMTHVFMHGMEPASWHAEGLAMTYQHRAPFMTGMIGADAYIKDVNMIARSYYRNVKDNMKMTEATAHFWNDARARLQPYNRGEMYMAQLDARIRNATHGKHTIDDVVREFVKRRNAGKSVLLADWLNIARRYIGAQADKDYHDMMNGKLIILPSDAFGTGFKRVHERVPNFTLGFDIAPLMKSPRYIRHLDPNSPAAKAGLKEGDHVIWNTSLDTAQDAYDDPMVLKVKRGDKVVTIKFKPYGKMVDSYQWVRVKGMTDAQCRQ